MKVFLNKLKNLPKPVQILGFIFALVFVCLSVLCAVSYPALWFSYIFYVVGFIALIYLIFIIIIIYPIFKQSFYTILQKNKFTKKLSQSYGIRTSVSAVIATLFNFVYCLFLSILAYISNSFWVVCLALYYFALTIIKIFVLIYGLRTLRTKNKERVKVRKIKAYRNTGISFIFMAIAMSGMIVQMILMEADIKYPSIMIYVVAFYTFYRVTTSIINIFKTKKTKNYILQAIININLTSAFVSLFSLQVALISEFSNGADMFKMNLTSGILVSLFIIVLGVFMIVKGQKKLNKERQKESEKLVVNNAKLDEHIEVKSD